MNFLAHAYLSFNQPELLLGNMISDFVKGKKQFDYPEKVHKGIVLHRSIDAFTDQHDATHAIKEFFKPAYGLYAGAFADVVYDYFLANDSTAFPVEKNLSDFTDKTYAALSRQSDLFPENFDSVFFNMQQQNWLYNYRFKWGIEKSFGGLVRRAKYLSDANPAFSVFEKNIEQLQQCYDDFFPAVKKFVLDKIELI
jgi:acyl carrier protein phosphodiesterase